jgi:hypothetical protein
MFLLAQDPKQRPSIDECVRDLEQFLAQLPRDAEGMGPPAPEFAFHAPAPFQFPDSRVPKSLRASPPPQFAGGPEQPPLSLAVDVNQLSSLEPSDIGILMHAAGPDFKAKGYGKAAEKKKVTGDFILKANEVELSLLFSQMGVDAVDMPTLREAVASWRMDPVQVFRTIAETRERDAAAAKRAAEAHAAAKVRSGIPQQTRKPQPQCDTPNQGRMNQIPKPKRQASTFMLLKPKNRKLQNS